MGILNKLKSALGMGGASSSGRRDETDVTVEREPNADTEAAVKGTDEADTTASDTDGTDSTATGTEAATATDVGADAQLTDVKGIGPAYAERLSDAGVETVADLADADPAELGDSVGVSETRVQRWIDRANE